MTWLCVSVLVSASQIPVRCHCPGHSLFQLLLSKKQTYLMGFSERETASPLSKCIRLLLHREKNRRLQIEREKFRGK